ncbi:transglutaminase, partial [Mesorhizobium sp. M4B.F.Ca.ET.172.01.1.1]
MVGVSSLCVDPAAAQSTLFKRMSTQPATGASSATVGASTSVPYGWLDFCHRRPKECKVPALPAASVKLTAQNMHTLQRVNQKANRSIKPVSNYDHWGTMMDHW